MTKSKKNARLTASATLFLALLAFGGPYASADKETKTKTKTGKVSTRTMSVVGLASKVDGAKTTLRIRGESTPTFTVYKLENPSRVVVDIAGANLDSKLRRRDDKAVWNINSWAVGQVSAHNMGKTRSMVRVVVGLSRNSRYAVRAQGNDVVVEIVAKDKPTSLSPQALQAAKAEVAATKAQARLDAKVAKAEVVAARAQAKLDAKASKASKDAADSARIRAQKEALAAKAQSRLSAKDAKIARQEAASARAQAQRDANAARLAQQAANQARTKAQKELASARELARLDVLAIRADAKKEVAMARAKVQREAAAERAKTRKETELARGIARRAAEKEIADARAEAALIREQAVVSNRTAQARIAKAEKLMARADKRSANAQKASLLAATEISNAKKREKSAARAEVAAQNRQNEFQLAERAASVALSEAKSARTKNRSALQRKAEAAAEAAIARRVSAERALKQAESKRIAAEKEAALAGEKRRVAKQALRQADEERATAEQNRDAAVASRKSADSKRLHAQSTADKAASRARELKTLIQTEEKRFKAARSLRKQEELAVGKATRARNAAESQGLSAKQAQERLQQEIKELAVARKAARQRTLAAKVALRKANKAAADKKISAAEKTRLKREAERLVLSENRAAESLRTQEQKLNRQRQEVASLEAKKLAAAKGLASLEKKAAQAKERRSVEEAKLAGLATKRTQMRVQLDQARSIRISAQRELDHARRARHDAEQARSLAQETATQVQRELERAKLARMAAEKNRMEAAREILRAKQQELEAKDRFASSMRSRTKAETAKNKAVVAKAKKHEREAQKALEQAKRERKLAVNARLDGEKALKLANLREKEASAKLAKAKTNGKVVAVATKKVQVNTRLREIDVVERENVSRLVIAMSAPAAPIVVSNRGNEAILEIPMAGMRNEQERTLDTSRLGGAIKAVSSYRDPSKPGTIKVVVELKGKSKGVLKKVGNTYYWEFPRKTAARVATVKKPNSKVTAYKSQSVAGYGSASSPVTQQTVAQVSRRRKRRTYRGQKIDLDYKRSDIHDLMRLLAAVGGVNIIVPDDISARVTIRLRRVPWDQALDVILASKGLGFKMEGPKLYRIATRKELDAEFEAKLARARARADSESPEPQIFNLNYVQATVVQPQISSLLSGKGSVQVDTRTNALIINDVAANRARIVDLLTKLDTQTPQIQIEARIVEARSSFTRQFGIQWGGNMNASAAGGNATGLIFPSTIGLAGASDDGNTPTAGVAANPSNFAVNLPAAIGTGAGGGIGLSLGSVGGNLGLNLRLSALEDEGTVRIVSSPKITTSNNVQATISSGVSIPISVVSASGVQTQFVPAALELKVKPSVSLRDCAVSMEIEVTKNEADFVNTGARGDPTLLTKEAKSTILVQDGDTSVVGGIYTRNSGVAYSKVPFFGDLPVVGWLFKTTRENDERTELLLFITPKITNRAFLPCGE